MGADKQTQVDDLYLYRSLELILRYLFQTVDELTNPMDRVWAPVKCPKPEEGLLIVNLGKNMDFWSGGRLKGARIAHTVLIDHRSRDVV